MKKPLRWDPEKNKKLKKDRGIGFKDIQAALEPKGPLDTIDNPNQIRYTNQKMFVRELNGYIHLVPFVEDEEKIFMKTIYKSRKMTKKYLKKERK